MSSIMGPTPACAAIGDVYAEGFRLPEPGIMVSRSPVYNPPILKGIKVHPDNPFNFDFILDQGDESQPGDMTSVVSPSKRPLNVKATQRKNPDALKQESTRLIKYFLASLTIPEKDLWVNLSPYEKNRIVPTSFGQTEMGRDLLAEDYMLKQITASLIYPEDKIGKEFWKRIYQEAAKKFGTTNIPVNTFNKVWIVPDKAVVYENVKTGTAYIIESKLKVMLEEDYLSLSKHQCQPGDMTSVVSPSTLPSEAELSAKAPQGNNLMHNEASQILRQIVIPQLNKEVNEGNNFAQLRQVYNSLILATWYKHKIRDSVLEQVYANKNRVTGLSFDKIKNMSSPNVSIGDPEYIYQQYLKAFKKGVFNYIKEDPSFALTGQEGQTGEGNPRKYFSGGASFYEASTAMSVLHIINYAQQSSSGLSLVSSRLDFAINIIKNARFKNLKSKAMTAVSEAQEEVIARYLLSKPEHDINELGRFGESLGFSRSDFFELIRELSEQRRFKPDPIRFPKKFTSFIPTYYEDAFPTGMVKDYWALRDKSKRNKDWFMIAQVLVFGTSGKLFLQVRKDDGTLDTTVGGSVDIDLDGIRAAIKESREELIMDVDASDLRPIKNPARANGLFYFDFDDHQEDLLDQNGIFHAQAYQHYGRAISNIFTLALNPQQEQTWKQKVGGNIISWEEYLSGKRTVLNDEVGAIVEVDPKVLLEYYLSIKEPKARGLIFAQGLNAVLAHESIRTSLAMRVDLSQAFDEEHIVKSREMILKGAQEAPKDSVVVLGVGQAREIPLLQLLKMFDEVKLVDINPITMAKAIDGLRQAVMVDPSIRDSKGRLLKDKINDIKTYQIDITGGQFDPLQTQALNIIAHASSPQEAEVRIVRLFATFQAHVPEVPYLRSSYVVSSVVASQLTLRIHNEIVSHFREKFHLDRLLDNSLLMQGLNILREKKFRQHILFLSSILEPQGRIYWSNDSNHLAILNHLSDNEFGLLVDSLNQQRWFEKLNKNERKALENSVYGFIHKELHASQINSMTDALILMGHLFNNYRMLDNDGKAAILLSAVRMMGSNMIDIVKQKRFIKWVTLESGRLNPSTIHDAMPSISFDNLLRGLLPQDTDSWIWISEPNILAKGGVYQVNAYILKKAVDATSEPNLAMINKIWKMSNPLFNNPRKFLYTVKLYFPGRLLKPEGNKGYQYYSGSLVSDKYLKTIGDGRIGVVLDFPDKDLVAILKYMHQGITVGMKNWDGLKMFLRQHQEEGDERNLLYESVFNENNPLNLTPQALIRMILKEKGNPQPGYAHNTEIMIRNTDHLKVTAAILMAKDGIKMETTVDSLKTNPNNKDILEAINDGLPVVIVGDREADLNEARSSFLKAFPSAEPVSTSEWCFVVKRIKYSKPVQERRINRNKAMMVWNQDNITKVFEPEMEQHLPVTLKLSNIKKNGPAVLLKIKMDPHSKLKDEFFVDVFVNGKKTGVFGVKIYFEKDQAHIYKISHFSPIGSSNSSIPEENATNTKWTDQGISSTILNWLAWTAQHNNALMMNKGTRSFSLIRLYQRFFADYFLNELYAGSWRKMTNIIDNNTGLKGDLNNVLTLGQGRLSRSLVDISVKKVQGNTYEILNELFWHMNRRFDLGRYIRIDENGVVWSEGKDKNIVNVLYVNNTIVRGIPRPLQVPQIQIYSPLQFILHRIVKHINPFNRAQLARKNTGGIDLTPGNMNLQVKTGSPTKTTAMAGQAFGDDKAMGIKFHLDPAMLVRLRDSPGFVPVVTNVQPLKDLKAFLDSR